MPILPYSIFLLLLAMFLGGYLSGNIPLFTLIMGISIIPLFYQFLKARKIRPVSLKVTSLLGVAPHVELDGKIYTALALRIETPPLNETRERYEKEVRYDRLLRFTDALDSLGMPSAYITFSYPRRAPLRLVSPSSLSLSLLITFPSGRDKSELTEKTELIFRQMEGVCRLALPDCQTRRIGTEDALQLLSKPLIFAMRGMASSTTRDDCRGRTFPIPSPPAVTNLEPSFLFSAPSDRLQHEDGPFLGWIFSEGNRVAPLSLSLGDMRRHTAIFGCTGAGKSTTAISLALRLSTAGTPVLILDWHGEHSCIIDRAGGKVFALGSEDLGITINPLALLSNRDIATQLELAADTFSQTFQFTPPQSYMFREALKSSYGSKLKPTLTDVINELSLLPIRSSWDHETRMALMRRLKVFTEGSCGLAVNGPDSLPRDELFRGMVSLDLSHVRDVNSRAILANLLLKSIYDYAVHRGEQAALRHVLIVEEAQNILPPRRAEMPQSVGERILAEVRKYGEGVVIVSQFPSAVSLDVIKNTSIRIIHAVRAGDDVKVLGEATSLDQQQRAALCNLAPGEAIVNLPHRPANFFVRVVPDPLLELPEFTESVPEDAPRSPVE